MLLRQVVARPRRLQMLARASRQLAAGGFVAPDRLGDLGEGDIEDVVHQERGTLERREPLERHHQRQGDVVDLVSSVSTSGSGSQVPT